MLDLAIIGGGPAGLSAGLYATRGGLKNVVMFEKGMPGGQITSSSEIENYPGVAQVMDGISFMAPWGEQCMRFGLKHEMVGVEKISKNKDATFTITLEGGKSEVAKAVIVQHLEKQALKVKKNFLGVGLALVRLAMAFFIKIKKSPF